jgi:hypothetical protein
MFHSFISEGIHFPLLQDSTTLVKIWLVLYFPVDLLAFPWFSDVKMSDPDVYFAVIQAVKDPLGKPWVSLGNDLQRNVGNVTSLKIVLVQSLVFIYIYIYYLFMYNIYIILYIYVYLCIHVYIHVSYVYI